MRIVVIVPIGEEQKSYTQYLLQLLKDIFSADHYISEQTDHATVQKYHDDHIIIIKTTNRTNFSFKWWYNIVLTTFINKVQPQLVLHVNGCYNMKVSTSQICVITDTNYLERNPKELTNWRRYSRKNLSSYITKAKAVIIYAEAAKEFLVKNYNAGSAHFRLIQPSSSSEFYPLEWGEKQIYKLQYTQSREYFFAGKNFRSVDELVFLLKAFSSFKRWQHSSMKLVLAGKFFVDEKEWNEKLSTYKFREDVIVQNDLNDYYYEKLLASSYAFIHLPVNDSDAVPALEAVNCKVPVISSSNKALNEILASSVLTFQKDNFEDLGKQMILLYKDEILRDKMVTEGWQKVDRLTRENMLAKLKEVIVETVEK